MSTLHAPFDKTRQIFSRRKSQSNAELRRNDSVSVIVHELVVVGPIIASNLSLSKGLAAERARAILADSNHEMNLARLCDCRRAAEGRMDICSDEPPGDQIGQKVTDETEEGFATIAQQKLEEDYIPPVEAVQGAEDELDDETISTKI